MISRNNANARKIEAMSPELKELYLCSATRVTIGRVNQVVQKAGRNIFKTSYVAKIRGVIVGDEGEYMHETPDAAKEYGKKVLKQWQDEFFAKNKVGVDPAKPQSDVTVLQGVDDGKLTGHILILPPIRF